VEGEQELPDDLVAEIRVRVEITLDEVSSIGFFGALLVGEYAGVSIGGFGHAHLLAKPGQGREPTRIP